MTGTVAKPRAGRKVLQAGLLIVITGVLFVTTRAAPDVPGGSGTIAAVGFLLLAGTLLSELVELIGIPHLTGYLVAGIVAGPHVLHLIDHRSVQRLSSVNTLALALIAMAGGAELKMEFLRRGFKSLGWSTLLQSLIVPVLMMGVFAAARPLMPFAKSLTWTALAGVALLWGIMSVTRSPSATLGILSQTRAQGPLARFVLTFVMTSDVVVVVLMAVGLTIARPLIEPGADFSSAAFRRLGHEIIGSVSLGTTLGIVLVLYMRLVGKQLLVVFIALGFGFTEVLRYLNFEPLLTFMVAGFLVQNLSSQGEKFLHAIEQTGGVVYVVFFATAGADLDVPLLKLMWPVALVLTGSRALVSWTVQRISGHLANDAPSVRKWGWSGLISQAGLALGLGSVVTREFPAIGTGFRALVIATVAINELVGPVVFKFALDRLGETSRAPEPSLPSIRPPPPAPST